MKPTVKVVRTKDVPMPEFAHEGDAGMDLCATEDITLYPGDSVKMDSGLRFEIPRGYVGYVFARSGLGMRGLVIKNGTGVIDSTYRGEVGLALFNNNPTIASAGNPIGPIAICKGDRVAQIVFQRVEEPVLVEVEELEDTARGEGGFGSTGVK